MRLSRILPITHIAFPEIAAHNIIDALATTGRLGAFFRTIFDVEQPLPSRSD